MKIILSNSKPSESNHIWVSDISSIDLFVDDSESTEIIIDSMLTSFSYTELGTVLAKAVSKLRINGRIIIYEKDIDMICHHYNKMGMGIQDINNLLFDSSSSIASVLNTETIIDALKQIGLKIEEQFINSETMQSIVTARRTNNEN
jgi:ABC-type uncharacterized transport system YnjBCD ATPase subunit|tara:strand:+ start:23 stop:460 length:438 start_codon:yes stop_codon:yes gene_type:complete